MKLACGVLAAISVMLGAYQLYIQGYMASPARTAEKEISPDHMENIRPVFVAETVKRSKSLP